MRIKRTVDKLCAKYKTHNPFEIAETLEIPVLFERLGDIRGFYSRSYRQKVIHINRDINAERQLITCAHELGHAIIHPCESTPFLRASTLFSIDKLELEANRFMTQMIVPDDDIQEYIALEYTLQQIASVYGLPEHLIEYKLRLL